MDRFWGGLDENISQLMPGGESRWTLAEYIDLLNGSPLTVVSPESSPIMAANSESSPIMATSPEPSPPSPHCMELPEPTADGEPEPAAVIEPSQLGATELMIALEPEPQVSDQVREPTAQATIERNVEIVGAS